MIHRMLHYVVHHWHEVLTFGLMFYVAAEAILEMIFNHGPLDHSQDTYGEQ